MFLLLEPRMLHGALVHFPIALLVAAVVLGSSRSGWAREAYVVAGRAAAAAAVLAVVSGFNLAQGFSPSAPLEDHQQAALLCAALALISGGLAVRAPRASRLVAWAAMCAVAVAAHRGGVLRIPMKSQTRR